MRNFFHTNSSGNLFFALFFLLLLFSCNGENRSTSQKKDKTNILDHCDSVKIALAGLYDTLGEPENGEWRYKFKESHESYHDYIACKPIRASVKRNIIYIQPIGNFDSLRFGIIKTTAEYLKAFYGLEVKIKNRILLNNIPSSAKRKQDDQVQVLTQYIMFKVLEPVIPDDAAAYIGFTTVDLYPEEGWNFVFGQASYEKRIGVWSLFRFGNPDESKEMYKLCLNRTLKTASHETGHMFSLPHCVKYLCNMNGSISLEESDVQPEWLCPECMCKICWNFKISEKKYLKDIKEFWEKYGDENKINVYEKMLSALEKANIN